MQVCDYCFTEIERYEIDHDGFDDFQPMPGVFDDKIKLVVNLITDDELYDLDKDFYKMDNLIKDAKHTKERNLLYDVLLDWMNIYSLILSVDTTEHSAHGVKMLVLLPGTIHP